MTQIICTSLEPWCQVSGLAELRIVKDLKSHNLPDHNDEVKLFPRCVGAGVIGPLCLHPAAHNPGISDARGSGEAGDI